MVLPMTKAQPPDGVAGDGNEDDHGREYDVIGISKPSGQAEGAEHDDEDRGGAAERGDDRSDDAGREQPLRGHAVLGEVIGRRSMGANIARPTWCASSMERRKP